MNATTRAWHYIKGGDSVRIVIDGSDVIVHGPAGRFTRSRCGEPLAAALHQSALEQTLVLDGWTLERITTEQRVEQPSEPPARTGGIRLTTRTKPST